MFVSHIVNVLIVKPPSPNHQYNGNYPRQRSPTVRKITLQPPRPLLPPLLSQPPRRPSPPLPSLAHGPEGVGVTPGAEATRLQVELVGAHVVFHHVAGRSLLHLHALVPVRRDGVAANPVAVTPVLSVFLPLVGNNSWRYIKIFRHIKCKQGGTTDDGRCRGEMES